MKHFLIWDKKNNVTYLWSHLSKVEINCDSEKISMMYNSEFSDENLVFVDSTGEVDFDYREIFLGDTLYLFDEDVYMVVTKDKHGAFICVDKGDGKPVCYLSEIAGKCVGTGRVNCLIDIEKYGITL